MAEGAVALVPQPLTSALFRPYGHVIRAEDPAPLAVNAGTALRHDVAGFSADARPGSRLIVSVFEVEPQALPLEMRLLERHPHSEQAIVAMGGAGLVFAVCDADGAGRPDLRSLRAFHCPAGSGVIYGRGIWHSPIIGVQAPGWFFVQSWQDGTAADCEEMTIPPHVIGAGGIDAD